MRLGSFAAGWAALALSTSAMPAVAQDSPALAPSTPWNIDYDTDSCALRRVFGEGDRQAFLELRRFDRAPGLQATVTSNLTEARRSDGFKYRFGGNTDWSEATANRITTDGGFSGVLFSALLADFYFVEDNSAAGRAIGLRSFDWQAVEKEAAARADSLALRGVFSRPLVLQLGSLEKPIEALNQCVDELMTHWGIDVEAHKTLTRPAVPINLPEVPRMIDYPPKMLRQRLAGVVNIRLSIDERGQITACHIQMPLSDPAFEESSCADVQHALEFEPALDKDGKPIPSYWITKVVFQIG